MYIFIEKIQEMSLTNTQIMEISSISASFIKCYRTSDFVQKDIIVKVPSTPLS